LILEYRTLAKLKGTYVDALPELTDPQTGRVHASFRQTGTETGRLSSSDPNLQNIPIREELGRSIRAAFRAGTPGWKIISADYAQIELRMLAHYSRDEALLTAFAEGQDIHAAVAARLYGVKVEDVTREQRGRAKTVNFGILYGQTAFGLAQTLGLSRGEAQKIIDAYFSGHPGVRDCLAQIVADAEQKGYVTTLLGRRRFVPQLAAKDANTRKFGERIAVNTVFQGSAADLIKQAMIDLHRTLNDPKKKWKTALLLQIHDELLLETPPDEVEAAKELVKTKMENALPLVVKPIVEVCCGDDWLAAKP
jgi:DNA polymerase-1